MSKVLAKHILIQFDRNDPADRARAYELAQDVRRRILDGESFSRLAKQYSQDPLSARRGGGLGWGKKGEYEGAVEEYVWRAPIGEVGEVLSTKYGFHIVVVTERLLSEADQYKINQQEAEEAGGTGAPAGE